MMDSSLSRRDVDGDDTFESLSSAAGPAADGDAPPTAIGLVKVFSATKARDREILGDRVTAWLEANPTVEVVRTSVTQSSDHAFHCLTLVLLCAALPSREGG